MKHVVTLVASPGNPDISKDHLKEMGKILGFYNFKWEGKPEWLCKKRAVDLGLADKPQSALLNHFRDFLSADKIDIFISPAQERRKKLLIADMDATIIAGETLDELAEHAGIKDQVSKITQAAMEGKLDFKEALRGRVALLKDLPAAKLQETLDKMVLNPGAAELVQAMRGDNATCVLVSGGFTFFTGAIATRCAFHHHHGNELEIADAVLTGRVVEPILDKQSKLDFLNQYISELGIAADEVMAIGDGANDIPMLKNAGLGIGYQPKAAVAEEIENLIVYGDLSAALYAQGYTEKDLKKLKKAKAA